MRTTSKDSQFAICVTAKADGDLIVGKTYQVMPDKSAREAKCLRVIDESGEDYMYPAARFVLAEVP